MFLLQLVLHQSKKAHQQPVIIIQYVEQHILNAYFQDTSCGSYLYSRIIDGFNYISIFLVLFIELQEQYSFEIVNMGRK